MTHPLDPLTNDSDSTGFPIGAHLSARRTGYLHHGVYVGSGEVIHLRRPFLMQPGGRIEQTRFETFARGPFVCVETPTEVVYAGADVVLRARSRLGESGYSLLRNNCEHFSNWCVQGVARSRQVERLQAKADRWIAQARQQLMLHLNLLDHSATFLWSTVLR